MYRKKADLYKNHHDEKQRLLDSPFPIIEILKVMFFGLCVQRTACHIRFLKQNISYCVSVLEVIFPLLFVDCLHYLTLKSPRGF